MILFLKLLGIICLIAIAGVIVSGCLYVIANFWDDIKEIIDFNKK